MKPPQIKFHADSMSDSKVIRSKKSKFIVKSKFIAAQLFSLDRYFINATTTDVGMLLQVEFTF